MTDIVNVPREALEKAVAVIQHLGLSLQDGGEAAFRARMGLLAAAPKAEPVSAPYKLVREAINGLIEWDKKTGFRVPYRVRDPLHSALALIQPLSNPQQLPKAPKVEQEPTKWEFRIKGIKNGFLSEWDECDGPDAHEGIISEDVVEYRALYDHPAPASDELLEALEPFAKAAKVRLCGEWGDDERCWNTDAASFLTFGDLRRAERLYDKHKGPQS